MAVAPNPQVIFFFEKEKLPLAIMHMAPKVVE
jgi:hypothetical protein